MHGNKAQPQPKRKTKTGVVNAQQKTKHVQASTGAQYAKGQTPSPKQITSTCNVPKVEIKPKPKPTYSIRGTVRDIEGQPLAGVTVTVSGDQAGQAVSAALTGAFVIGPFPEDSRLEVRAASGTLVLLPGLYAIDKLAHDETCDFAVAATVIKGAVRPGTQLPDETVFFQLLEKSKFSLTGDMILPAVTMQKDGTFEFAKVPRGGNYQVNAVTLDSTYAGGNQKAVVADQETKLVQFDIPCFSISGTVKDIDASGGLGGATLTLSGDADATEVTKDQDGTFTFGPFPKGRSFQLSVKLDTWVFTPSQAYTLNGLSKDEPACDFTLEGTVIRTSVKPAGGVAIDSFFGSLGGCTFLLSGVRKHPVALGLDGKLSFPKVPRGAKYMIGPPDGDLAFATCQPQEVITSEAEHSIVFDIPCHKISGEIKGLAMLMNAAQTCMVLSSPGMQEVSVFAVPGGDHGTFEFPLVPAGRTYLLKPKLGTIEFNPPEMSIANLQGDAVRNTRVKVVLLSGICRHKNSPLDAVEIQLSGDCELTMQSRKKVAPTFAAGPPAKKGAPPKKGKQLTPGIDHGSYEFQVPCGGNYQIKAVKKGFSFSPSPLLCDAINRDTQNLDFETGAFTVTLLFTGFDEVDLSTSENAMNKGLVDCVITGGGGTLTFNLVKPNVKGGEIPLVVDGLVGGKNYKVELKCPAYYVCNCLDPILPLTNLSQNVTLHYQAVRQLLTVQGTVTNPGGNVNNITVNLYKGPDTVVATTTTNGVGAYTFANVVGGPNMRVEPLRITDRHTCEPWHRKFNLLEANQAAQDFTFSCATAPPGSYYDIGGDRRCFLSEEAKRNLAGERGMAHLVPVHLLVLAIRNKWNKEGGREGGKHIHEWNIPAGDPLLHHHAGYDAIAFVVYWDDKNANNQTLVTAYMVKYV